MLAKFTRLFARQLTQLHPSRECDAGGAEIHITARRHLHVLVGAIELQAAIEFAGLPRQPRRACLKRSVVGRDTGRRRIRQR